MADIVIRDKYSSPAGVKERKFDTPATSRSARATEEVPSKSDSADQRFVQLRTEFPAPRSATATEARERLAQLQDDIATNASAVMRAHGHTKATVFRAAIAEPGV